MSVPEPVLGEPLAESAIAVPPTIDVPATHEHAQSRSVVGVRGAAGEKGEEAHRERAES